MLQAVLGALRQHFRILDVALVKARQGRRKIGFRITLKFSISLRLEAIAEIGLILVEKGNAKKL